MTTGSPGPALAGDAVGPPARDGSAGARVSVFALPAKTSFRFALLIVAVLTSSGMVYEAIYFATPRGAALAALVRVCQARALATHPQGYSAYAAALARARACRAGGERVEGLWALLGIGVLAVLAGAMYWAQPWWYRRHRRLVPLTSEEAPKVIERLEQLREQAGVGPVTWLQQPLNFAPSAFAFGRVRRRIVAVSGGAVVSQARQPVVFDAIVVHELGHIRNRDIDQTYLAVAVWWAFVVAALLPMAGLLISGKLSPPAPLIWRAVVLALLVYLLRNSILRSREFGADARVAELDPDTRLGQVLAGQPPRRGRRIWHMGWLHPSGRDRAAALLDPAPVYRCGFWDGLAIGLVAAMGAEAGRDLAERFLTPSPGTDLIPAFIFALFSGAALTVAMWRMRLLPGGTATAGDWAEAARTTSAWVVVLVFIAVPLSGFLAGLRQRSLGDGHWTAPATRRWLNRARPAALICLAGLVAVIAVTLVTAAVARAHIAPAIRWNGLYFGQFLLFEEQMVILLAVIIALIAAAVLTYELSDMIAIVVAAVVAALGILAVMGSRALGNCVALFNLTYGHQPAGDCPGAGDPRSLVSDIFPAALEAALISILLIPAAYYAGILIARRASLGGRPRLATRALGWVAAGAVAAAVIVGISLRVPDASAHGIQPIGSIGQDGWVYGTGYEIRIFPNWYDSPASNRGNILIVYDGRYSGVSAYLTLLTVRVGRDAKITGKGGHAFLLNGAPGLTFMSPDVHGYFIQRWLVIRGSLGYILTFRTMTADRASREPNISSMINTWQWDANSS
jgi:Zn-dependent protease with chaperone function